MKLLSPIALTALVTVVNNPAVSAVEPAPIVASIEADSVSRIVMPEALMQRLLPGEPEDSGREDGQPKAPRTHAAGFRVQVFSDNNARTAKNEARRREGTVASRFPQYRTYKKYSAPYWRLRVGDFRTQREAESAAADLRRAFPSFSREIRVVRDRINLID